MSENGGAKLYRFAWLPLKYVLLNHYVFFTCGFQDAGLGTVDYFFFLIFFFSQTSLERQIGPE